MTIILQGTDQVHFHPITGKPLKPKDYRKDVLSDGRTVIHLGDTNKLALEPKKEKL